MAIQGVSGQDLRALNALSPPRTPPDEGAREKAPEQAPSDIRAGPEPREVLAQRPEARTLELPGADRAGTRLRMDDGTDRIIAQIVGRQQEVIKQIPPEEQLKVIRKARQIQGLLFDKLV